MAHRFINLQNELGKPVIAAGTKRPSDKDFIDISWLRTTDENGEKIVVDTTLEAELKAFKEELKSEVGNNVQTAIKEVNDGLMRTIAEVATSVENSAKADAKEYTDKAIEAAKGQIEKSVNETIVSTANSVLNDANENAEKLVEEAKSELTEACNEECKANMLIVLTELHDRITETEGKFDGKLDAAKTEVKNDIKGDIDSVKTELEKKIEDLKSGFDAETILALANDLLIKISIVESDLADTKKELDSAQLNVVSLTTSLEDTREALKNAVVLEEQTITTTNGSYTLKNGEQFISAVRDNEGITPTVSVSNGITTLKFFDTNEGSDGGITIQLTVAKKVDFYNASFIQPVEDEVTVGENEKL